MPVLDKPVEEIENNGCYSFSDERGTRSTWLQAAAESAEDETECHTSYVPMSTEAVPAYSRLESGASIANDIIALMEIVSGENILIDQAEEVCEYLLQYPGMVHLVAQICRTAAARFSDTTELALELYHDPEQEDTYLTLYVRQRTYAPAIMEQIETISALYEDSVSEGRGWIIITTDFQPPRRS